MQFETDRKALVAAVAKVALVAKASTPSLAKILIFAGEGFVTLHADDMDTAVDLKVPAKVASPGSVCVDAKALAGIKDLKAPNVTIRLEDKQVHAQSGARSMSWYDEDARDFPAVKSPPLKGWLPLDLTQMSRLLFCESTDLGRPHMCGVNFFSTGEGTLRLETTDGHRLSRVTLPGEHSALKMTVRGMKTLSKIVSVSACEMVPGDGCMFFRTDDTQLSLTEVEGEWPDTDMIIPRATLACGPVVFDKKTLLAGIKFVGPASGKNDVMSLTLDTQTAVLRCALNGKERTERVSCTIPDGYPLRVVGFDHKYLAQALVAGPAIVEMEGETAMGPVCLFDDGVLWHIIMPTRID
jgi:DNA polymerase III subunit beta